MPINLKNRQVSVGTGGAVGTGWLPPMLDPRDYTAQSAQTTPLINRLQQGLEGIKSTALTAPPTSVDLRAWCSPIENQGSLGSCTAHAAVGIVEYFERRAFGKHLDGSRLFIYKTTRNLLGVTGDTGAWLRNTMGALVLCGVPNEQYWPYTDAAPDFDSEPPSFVYSVAGNFQAVMYFAHDPLSAARPRDQVLEEVKRFVAAGVPSMFGFFGYPTFTAGDAPGHIPFPTVVDLNGDPAFGHAIVAVGYDDQKVIKNVADSRSTTGALLIRNSWGTTWGQAGYGWLPYEYVTAGIALDFWSLLKMEWVDTDQFYL